MAIRAGFRSVEPVEAIGRPLDPRPDLRATAPPPAGQATAYPASRSGTATKNSVSIDRDISAPVAATRRSASPSAPSGESSFMSAKTPRVDGGRPDRDDRRLLHQPDTRRSQP